MAANTPRNSLGFTLVEIIVVLLLVSILAATTGLLLTTFVRSYTLVRQSADVSQKAQLALKRMRLELESLSDVHTAGITTLYYRIKPENFPQSDRVLGLDGDLVKLGGALPVSAGNILVDEVVSLSLSYFDQNGNLSGTSNWSSTGSWNSPSVTNLYAIRIDLTLSHDSGNIVFSSIVYPSFRTGRDSGPLNWNSQ
ncbi:MAG: type II secretion system GspH family protein [Proteobacteria bacterium]|nr:type II secretion system GspH family protein [Pseudomonadota bacterium]